MHPSRWTEITPSEYVWEREALEYLKARLPDGEPFRAWSNFEFIAEDGSINEVDLLVVSLYKVYLVEIKSWPGAVSGDQGTWRREAGRKVSLVDSPLLLANRKAKKLAGLLKAQKALARQRRPYVESVVFLSHMGVRCGLEGRARTGVYLSVESERGGHPTITDVLGGSAGFDLRRPPPRIDRALSRAIARAVEQAGIRPSQRQRRVADYVLRELLLETDTYQDWEAEHVTVSASKRRVRIYPLSRASSEAARTERRRAADREYRLLDGIVHEGILRVEQRTDAEPGPALVFEHDPGAERLDHFLERRSRDRDRSRTSRSPRPIGGGAGNGGGDGNRLGRTAAVELDLATRLDLLRQLAETLKYAHERRLCHRALSPRKILVSERDGDPRPRLKIFDWRTGRQDVAASGSGAPGTPGAGGAAARTTLGLSGDDREDVYLAPETSQGGYAAEKLDLFSLGAIAYRLFSGHPPAPTVEALHERLLVSGGLRLSDALDGIPESLQVVVQCATDPEVTGRPDSVPEFLELLAEAERELAAAAGGPPEPEGAVVHPLDAGPGDRLAQGFRVERRLGKGSTAVALRVGHETDGGGVLKVALAPSLNDRIRREGEVLRSLRHQHVVEVYRDVELAGHAALFMAMAGAENRSGTYTLADRIREEGRLSLDLLQRFGDQLLNVVQWLEEKGISHRDLKPDNIGVSESRGDKSLALVVFDFSLADTPAENVRAGTPRYLDPFLRLRRPPRWDVYAERFAAAMTLHEMATGNLPGWGDGLTDPMLAEDEVSLDAEWFDPSVRAPLAGFFAKALARDYRARFDSAEEMRRAWFRCFEAIDLPAAGVGSGEDDGSGGDLPIDLGGVTAETALHALGLSPRLLNALDRLGAHTVAQLAGLPRIRLYRNKGIGQRIVKRIRELSERLAEHLANGAPTLDATATVHEDDPPVDPALWSIDLLASRLVSPHVPEAEARLLRAALGHGHGHGHGPQPRPRIGGHGDGAADAARPGLLPSHREVAAALGVTPPEVAAALRRARERWSRRTWMAPLRDTVAALAAKHGGVMTARELADALAATRGSTETGPARRRSAGAVAAAALEVESAHKTPRFQLHRQDGDGAQATLVLATEALDPALTASAQARAAWVRALGRRADELADTDPLCAPARVLEALVAVDPPAGMAPPGPDRLLRLAVQAAARAALSSRGELYPRGMAAARAVKLGASALLGPTTLSEPQLRKRLASRYPEAEPLPPRPALDTLLEDAGLRLDWNERTGTYHARIPKHPSHPSSTATGSATASGDDGADDARTLDERLQRVVETRGFLALSVGPRHLLRVERHLAAALALTPFSLEAALIRHMRAVAGEAGADWKVVLAADAAPAGGTDRRRLDQLVRRAVPRLQREIADAPDPLLLARPGLLARYRRLDALAAVQDAGQRGIAPAARILCFAADAAVEGPVIDDRPLPIVFAAAWVRPGRAWLARLATPRSGMEAANAGATPVGRNARQAASP